MTDALKDRRLLFGGAILLEVCVVAALWLLGRYFAG
jgi:hypothetical protein